MQSNPTTLAPRNGVLTLTGYGVTVNVERGGLAVSDGVADERRHATFRKATCGISRLVILGHSGTISLDAVRWLHDIGAALVQIDRDGQVLFASAPPGLDHAALRRAQALAATNQAGIALTRELLDAKLAGQAALLREMECQDAASGVEIDRVQLETAATLQAMQSIESRAAMRYWQSWESVPVTFARRDATKVPEAWQSFGIRTSPLTQSPRRAATPGNALLNYLYAILEAEARIALVTVGLDPGIGLLHRDQRSRDSLALDVMEAVRPQVDRWLYEWLSQTHFAANDFFEARDGTMRVVAPITAELTATAPGWANAVAPYAERVAAVLLGRAMQLPTPLTESNRRDGRKRVHGKRDSAGAPPIKPVHDTQQALRACLECGQILEGRRRKFCSDECRLDHRREVQIPMFAMSGPEALAKRRAQGIDPAHGGKAKDKRAASQSKRARERAEWEAMHGDGQSEREHFIREIQSKLAGIPLRRIAEATGFSLRYASLVRDGEYVPHPVHYGALSILALHGV
jgi:CRISPR-associated endonuclease Cas1